MFRYTCLKYYDILIYTSFKKQKGKKTKKEKKSVMDNKSARKARLYWLTLRIPLRNSNFVAFVEDFVSYPKYVENMLVFLSSCVSR